MHDWPITTLSSSHLAVLILSPAHPSAEGPEALRPRTKPRALMLAAAAILISGCAVATANRNGREAERRQDYDLAVVEYTKAVRLDPNNADARLGLDRAKLRAANEHFQRGRRLA